MAAVEVMPAAITMADMVVAQVAGSLVAVPVVLHRVLLVLVAVPPVVASDHRRVARDVGVATWRSTSPRR